MTEILAHVDDEGVKLVEELVLGGKRGLKHFTDFVVPKLEVSVTVAFEDATSVGVDYEYGMFTGVKKNGVGGFRADATQLQESIAEDCGGSSEKAGVGAAVPVEKKVYERLERFGFLPEVAGRAEKLGQSRCANTSDGLWREHACAAQVANGAFRVGPGSVLREDGTDDNFETSSAGPPVLRAIGREECVKIRARHKGRRKFGRRSFDGDGPRLGKRKIGAP
jgi:hypothetical protein